MFGASLWVLGKCVCVLGGGRPWKKCVYGESENQLCMNGPGDKKTTISKAGTANFAKKSLPPGENKPCSLPGLSSGVPISVLQMK